MIVAIRGECSWEGCKEQASHIAIGRAVAWEEGVKHPDVACYCERHAEKVTYEGSPEYVVDCPNCGCYFGVG